MGSGSGSASGSGSTVSAGADVEEVLEEDSSQACFNMSNCSVDRKCCVNVASGLVSFSNRCATSGEEPLLFVWGASVVVVVVVEDEEEEEEEEEEVAVVAVVVVELESGSETVPLLRVRGSNAINCWSKNVCWSSPVPSG